MVKVRRVAVGDSVELFDGKGRAVLAQVHRIERDQVQMAISGEAPGSPAPACSLTLATAVPKGDRFDWIVEKATELGVAKLAPLATSRSSVDPRPTKLDRLRKIIIEASKQCRRNTLMELGRPEDLTGLLRNQRESFRYIADPSGTMMARVPLPKRDTHAVLAVGPEGGFSEEELALAVSLGWVPISLGPQILRIETAGLVGSSYLIASSENDPGEPSFLGER